MCWCPFGQPGQPWVWFPYLAMLLYLLIFAIIIWLFKYKIYIYNWIYHCITPLSHNIPITTSHIIRHPITNSLIYILHHWYPSDISLYYNIYLYIPFPVLCHWYPKKQISIFFPILIYIKHQWYPIYPTRWCPPVISWFKLNPLTSSLCLA